MKLYFDTLTFTFSAPHSNVPLLIQDFADEYGAGYFDNQVECDDVKVDLDFFCQQLIDEGIEFRVFGRHALDDGEGEGAFKRLWTKGMGTYSHRRMFAGWETGVTADELTRVLGKDLYDTTPEEIGLAVQNYLEIGF